MIEATYREICCSEAALFPMSRPPPDFPITATSVRDPLHVLEGRWTLQILLCLSTGDLRFSDLRVALPVISANVLTQRMRDLETAGLVERRWLPPPAASQVYALAPQIGRASWRARVGPYVYSSVDPAT